MSTCILTGNLISGDGTPFEGAYIHAIPYDTPSIVQGTNEAIVPCSITALTTSTGDFTLELVRNVQFTVTIPIIGFKKTIRVPDLSTEILWSLTDIFVSGDSTPADVGEEDW